ncbi:MAG TPA: ABC transporter permease subunit [Candidatus Methylomirabilis sp.]|nr:ABC transporter permease subunit [Candidatus Methylomirabilis sp.]
MRRPAFWISLALVLGSWEAYVRLSGISPFFLVPPSVVLERLGRWLVTGQLLVDLGASVLLLLAGLGLAAAIAIPAGLSLGVWRGLADALGPYLLLAYATPAPVLLPMLLMWFGFTALTRVLIVAMFAFLPILLNVWWGVRGVDASWLRVAQVFCASPRELLIHVVLPGSVGPVLASLRIGGGLALIGLFVAETYGAAHGIGYQTIVGAKRMDITGVLAGLSLLGLLGVTLEQALAATERMFAPWRATS